MSDVIEKAISALTEKFSGGDFDSTVKFAIEDEGDIFVDGGQTPPAVSAGGGDADVTITAALDVFEEMMAGDLDPTSAFMTGRLKIDGDMGVAMKLAQTLA
ncbi:MAG: SCP2 sterol-binding domain-containing protein [Pseudomonadota bacterium]